MVQDKILNLLRTSQGYLSAQEISKLLGINSGDVDRLIQNLRNLDYDIESRPHLGYKLISSPDKLYPQEISWRLKNKLIGRKILYFDEVASTMDIAHKLGMEGELEGSCVFANSQLKGRGRYGRMWYSPEGGGIYLSLLLRPSILPDQTHKFTLLSSVCVGEAIQNITGLTYTIKWPNDILINEKKVAGILTELHIKNKKIDFIVIGIGVNVNPVRKKDSCGVNSPISQFLPNATSIREELGYGVKRQDLAREILNQLEFYYLIFKKGEFKQIVDIWKNKSFTLGRRVKVIFKKNKNAEGIAIDLDKDGNLLVRDDTGFIKKIIAGEVERIDLF